MAKNNAVSNNFRKILKIMLQILQFIRKTIKLVISGFSKCDFIAVLRALSVILGKCSIFGFNRLSLYLVIKGNEYKKVRSTFAP